MVLLGTEALLLKKHLVDEKMSASMAEQGFP